MAHADFVHLHVHSAYSLSEGAITVKKLAELCRKHRMPAVAVTDTGNLFGAMEFSLAAADEPAVQPIVGCQIHVAREGETLRTGRRPDPDQLVLLVQNATGYENLCHLSSRAFLETASGEIPQVSYDDLAAAKEGLIALTGGPRGAIGRLLLEEQKSAAEALFLRLKSTFGDRLYVELMRHGTEEEARIEPALLDLAYRHDVPLVATNDVYFADASMFEAHDALICIAGGTTVAEPKRRRFTPEHRFKSAEEMKVLFADLPEAIANTLTVARRCAFAVPKKKPILPRLSLPSGRSAEDELAAQADAGLAERLEASVWTEGMDEAAREVAARPYRERLAYEVAMIAKMGFASYFLIVADFIQWAKTHGVPVGPGRGSGAGSLVAWALTITDLDPLRFGLLFERFLNPDRVSMPDFDIDFCQDKRDRVIRYVQDKYGHDRVAQIITFGKLQARAAVRDVGRVLGLSYGQVDKLAKLVPHNPAKPVTLRQAVESEPRLQQARDEDETVARLLDIAIKIEGLFRHASTHAAGVVMVDEPLERIAPVYRDPRSSWPVTQFEMKAAESAGLVKFDFLGLKTLTMLDTARAMLARRGVDVDWNRLPLDDVKTYDMLSRGETVGVFQLEGTGMRDSVVKLGPDRLEDLIALVALYRPGPMENIPRYINCKHGKERPDYLHPLLEPVLKETFGIAVYQEQVMEIAKVLSGYSLGQADLLRRAMGKKIKSEMDAQRETFVAGAIEKGVEAGTAAHIFEVVEKFAGYGFNKSHAAAYALVSYQTAWLKANHPVEFMAASMSLDRGDTDKLAQLRQEAKRLKVQVLPPDVNESEADFSVKDGAVRYALAAIKNVGLGAMETLVAERERGGRFASIQDFARRVDSKTANKKQLESLICAGAFDTLERNRARLLASVETVVKHVHAAQEARGSSQVSLFGGEDRGGDFALAKVDAWSEMERLKKEMEAIGFHLSGHPIEAYGQAPERLGVTRIADIARKLGAAGDKRVVIAGILVAVQNRTTSKGTPMAFLSLSDPSGQVEITAFSEVLSQARDLLSVGQALYVSASAQMLNEMLRLTANRVDALDRMAATVSPGLRIVVDNPEPLPRLRKMLTESGRGKGRVDLVLKLGGGDREAILRLRDSYALGAELRSRLRAEPGILDVAEV